MRSVDDAVLAALTAGLAGTDATVCDGEVRTVEGGKVAESIPYVVYYSTAGDTDAYRLSGRSKRRRTDFQLTSVGTSRAQAKWMAEKSRALIEGVRLGAGLVRHTDSDYVRPDNDARTTANELVFYAVDRYAVSI